MRQVRFDGTFAGWRDAARDLLRRKVAPHQVEWLGSDDSGGLFDEPDVPEPSEPMSRTRIPRQLIDELEPHRRHLYTGAMGYLGFDGRSELNIAIRTITCVNGRAYFHAGGGVVWDSNPTSEYEETLTKAKALRAALEPGRKTEAGTSS